MKKFTFIILTIIHETISFDRILRFKKMATNLKKVNWIVPETVKHNNLDFLYDHILGLYIYLSVSSLLSFEKTENVT